MAQARKVVVVTGCSTGGIGFSLCEQFSLRGCKVYATSRNLESMKGFTDPGIEKLAMDIRKDEEVQGVIAHILEVEGRIDVVVNNAGVLGIGPLIDLTEEQILRTFDTNTFSLLRVARAVIPSMAKRRSGLIVNIGSISGHFPTPWNGIYCASKAALHSLSEALAMECRPFNIDVMLVAAGTVRSHLSKNQAAIFSLPEGTLYSDYSDQIMARMYASQTSRAMPTDVFAKRVVTKALAKWPPSYISLGGFALASALFMWMPRSWVLSMLWKRFSSK